jgi:hypothetical protein
MLATLLESLAALRFAGEPPALQVMVTDNDQAGSAREVVEGLRPGFPWPLHYQVEPVRNIALARNRGIRGALALGAQRLAFVDDDERVSPQWLEQLLAAMRRYDAMVTCGPVMARLDPAISPWVARGGFFGFGPHPTGTRLTYATSANLLARAELFAGGTGFNPELGLLGGSDALLFAEWRARGVSLVAVEDAGVEETIPASRGSAGWVLRRAFRVGNTAILVEKALPPGSRRLLSRLARSSLRLGYGLVLLLPSALLGRGAVLRALWSICFGAGSWAAVLGYRYMEYRNVHGD